MLGAKIEATPGTEETLTNADYDFNVIADSIAMTFNFEPNSDPEKFANGNYGEHKTTLGVKNVEISFSTYWYAEDTLTDAPETAKLLSACGLVGAVVGSTGYKFEDLVSGTGTTLTFNGVQVSTDGASSVTFPVVGATGKYVKNADIGGTLKLDWTFTGAFELPVDSTPPVPVADPNKTPLTFKNVDVTIGSTSGCVKTFSYDNGGTVEPLYCSSATEGIQLFSLTPGGRKLALDVAADTVANDPIFADTVNEVVKEIIFTWPDDKLTLTFPVCQHMAPEEAFAEGFIRYNEPFNVLQNGTANADIADEASIQILQGTLV
jgi:hypothetical protein